MERFTEPEKAEVWDRYRAGEPMRLIARRLGRESSSIRTLIMRSGGVRPRERRRDRRHLSLAEREEISRGVAAGESSRSIARRLERSPSTVSRELVRNGGRHWYRAAQAEWAAWQRTRRPKTCKLATNPLLALVVEAKLRHGGHLSRSPDGCRQRSRTIRRCGCHTKRST